MVFGFPAWKSWFPVFLLPAEMRVACLSSQSPPVLVFLPHLQVLEKRKVRLATAGISRALCWELEKAPQVGPLHSLVCRH